MAVYKYSCRKCPIRNRCVRESRYTTSVKNMIRNAFEARTDTLATWGLLQVNCLLIKAEEEQERKAQEESTLRRRLREARQSRRKGTDELRAQEGQSGPLIRRLPQAQKAKEDREVKPGDNKPASDTPEYLRPVTAKAPYMPEDTDIPAVIGASDPGVRGEAGRKGQNDKPAVPCWLTIKGSGRRIGLPTSGEVILGRFDATFGIPPDIDLAYEDGDNRTVSRRHARIAAGAGGHTIEDTGSRYGVFLNGELLQPGLSQRLTPGDRVAVGGVQMFFDQIPEYMQDIPKNTPVRHILVVTPTGRKVQINPGENVVIGRSDRFVDFVPEIDLSRDGEAAARVSRRHAIIQWRNNRPYLEDLGSGFGTRINGRMILIGQATPLKPGDHIWLGGCVLAYDVEH